MSPAAVAIAVVSTNTRGPLSACLRSMQPEHEAGRAEVWVVDNASTDGSPELVREEFPWVSLIASETNLGYGRAINQVAKRTETPWLAPANEDIELRPGALERLLRTGDEHPEAAIVAPRLELPDGSTQQSVHSFPTLGFTIFFNLGLHRLSSRVADRLCIGGFWDPSRPRAVPWAIATFMLVRRAPFEAAGGFSSDQFMYSDDLDMGWRFARAGWATRYEPSATVFHIGHVAGRKAFGDDVRPRMTAASYSWMTRRRGLLVTWSVAVINVAGAAARWGIFTLLAHVAPRRFGSLAAEYRGWARAHRTGLRRRRSLLSAH